MAGNQSTRSGGVDLSAGQISIGGDVVGRDKIVNSISVLVERALSAAEEAEQAKSFEAQRLAQGVSAFAQRLQARASDTTDADKGGPYKGLLEYRLSDAEIFFGRARAIRELFEHLQRGPLTVLHAESGAGKTSLLQAGIAPRLIAAGHLPVHLRPYNVVPSLAFKRAFLPNLNDTPNLAQASLRDFLSRVSDVLGSSTTLYIFLDQFEEFFTQLEEQARPEFVRELAECLDDESLNVRWVLALRSEFFGNLATFRPRIRNPFENDYRLNRLTRDEAREAVAEPAVRRGIAYEDGLVDTILDDLGKDEVAPPQVQLVCSTLYEVRSLDQSVITRELYAAQGGAAGILRGHLGRVLNRDLPTEQRPVAQRLLEALITSDIRRVIRTRAELASELAPQGMKPERLDAILSQLVDSRLLRIEEVDGRLAYELAHDYLLDEIKLDPAVQARKAAQELLEQEVRTYQRYGTLVSDDKLAIIETRRAELVLSDDAKALLVKSERALKRRQRIVRGGIGLVAALFIIGAISVVSAIGAGQQQQIAVSTQRAAEAAAADAVMQQANAQAAAATAQALQATSEAAAATATAREAIAKEALRRTFDETGVVPVGKGPSALAFDGTRLWVVNMDDNSVQSIDPDTSETGAPISVGSRPSALAFDGTRLWVANGADGTVQEIDPVAGDAGAPIPVGGSPSALAFDGTRLWVANYADNTVRTINPSTSEASAPIAVGDGPFALVFDGTRLWVANLDDNTVQAISPSANEASAPIPVNIGPSALSFDGAELWVASVGDNSVQIINPTTVEVSGSIPVGRNPSALIFVGTRLWVANRDDNTVRAVKSATGVASKPIPVGTFPTSLAFDGTRLWVASSLDNIVQAIDTASGVVMDMHISVGASPLALAFDGRQVWVANEGDDTVQAIDPATGEVSGPITVGSSPLVLAFDGRRLWVANGGEGTVQAIDPATGEVSAPIRVGNIPIALAFDTRSGRLWVANQGDGTVQAMDMTTGEVGGPITVVGHPSGLAFDGTRLWVANGDDGTVQTIDPSTDVVGMPIPVGGGPSAMVFDGKRLWVANATDNTVQAIDLDTGIATTPISVGGFPLALAFDGQRLWVANYLSSTVQHIVVR